MNKYNVFDKIFHYKSFLYWQNLKRLPRQLKWAKQRVTKGYCRSDWYDMDSWFAHVVADMFDEYAENTCSHPWEINDPDDWKDILIWQIAKLRFVSKTNGEKKNFINSVNFLKSIILIYGIEVTK